MASLTPDAISSKEFDGGTRRDRPYPKVLVGTGALLVVSLTAVYFLGSPFEENPDLVYEPRDGFNSTCNGNGDPSCQFFKYDSILTNPSSIPSNDTSILSNDTSVLSNDGSAFTNETNLSEDSSRLNDSWTMIYGLNRTAQEIEELNIQGLLDNATVPPAPHLRNCPLMIKRAWYSEKYDSKTGYPGWTLDSYGPKPPWIRGGDEDNLPFTRLVQRDIWINQHPLNCRSNSLKFVLSKWTGLRGHGLGSQLHVMAMLFSVSLASNRVFVPYPRTFRRAQKPTCQGESYSSLSCYFTSLVSGECVRKAMYYFRKKKMVKNVLFGDINNLTAALNANEPLVFIDQNNWRLFKNLHRFPNNIEWPKYRVISPTEILRVNRSELKQPWKDVTSYMELEEKNFRFSDTVKFRMWMLSQVLRYMLRWPSLHLCHIMNIERHTIYGRYTIDLVMKAYRSQSKTDLDEELKKLGGFESKNWIPSEPQFLRDVMDEPYIPRPIVSVHVRQGDKGIEMKLFPFKAYMYFANKLRYHEPNLNYAWLSTEMQTVLDEIGSYPDWTFFYSNLTRQRGTKRIYDYENMVGRSKLVDTSFVNLMIASECDYFVGTLGSNWNLLINALRMTNGRVKSKYLALNLMGLYFGP